MSVPEQILQLIETFDRNRDAYHTGGYNETQLRREFIDPFFEALGWDVANESGYAPAYRDVIHEDAIKIGTATKAPDYSFRIGGARKFFVEAKKPSVDIKEDAHPAYQLRRYAWSAKLPLSILTDFEEFAVYDCLTKPSHTDRASTGRIMYFTCKEYVDHWDEIAQIFSKEAIQKGSFDKFAAKAEGKRGTSTVDKEFLKEIESWRENLANHIARQNRELGTAEVNFAVQRTIDRILFLRMCEDRGIEPYGQLLAIKNGREVYHRLGGLFEKADAKYNSGLFYFRQEKGRNELPDEMTLGLNVPDEPIGWILHRLYYPQPYEFSVIPPEILGNVYEQFLGKVIRITPARMVKIEDKPEVKKAGGVYYTPEYIVDYIVKNTVGKLCEGKTPKEISKLRILDPACGSGSFLLGAYTYLLNYYRDWYVANEPEKYTKQLYQGKGGQWYLTISEKKQILLNNIYGVDIDSQAVEVTKLSLLLKVLEGESQETVQQVFRIFHERALPDLGNNIKCGNSLIGPDFFDTPDPSVIASDLSAVAFAKAEAKQSLSRHSERSEESKKYLSAVAASAKADLAPSFTGGSLDELRQKINPFDWKKEFPDVFKQGGFNAVIGNPPYISVELTIKDITEYYLNTFKSAYGRTNSFSLFIEKALELLSKNGCCGLITSNRILTNTQLSSLRRLLLENAAIKSILTFKKAVFKAAVDTTVITFQKIIPTDRHIIEAWFDIQDLGREDFKINKIRQASFSENPSFIFNIKQREKFRGVIQNILQKSVNLEKICDVKDGIILGGIKDLFLSNARKDNRYEKWLEGNEVSRYHIKWKGRYICYDNKLIDKELKSKRDKAKEKAVTSLDFRKIAQSGLRLRIPEIFRQKKILTRQNAKRLIGIFDESYYFVKNSLHCILLRDKSYNLKYILGLINSQLMDFYFQDRIGNTGEIFSQMKIAYVEKLPIRTIDFKNPVDKAKHDKMVPLVEKMLELHKKFTVAKIPDEKTKIRRQIESTDYQIDNLVYDLYALTEEEIKIVEKGNR